MRRIASPLLAPVQLVITHRPFEEAFDQRYGDLGLQQRGVVPAVWHPFSDGPRARASSRQPCASFRLAIILAASALLLLPGCLLLAGRHWEESRQSEIEPINSALHRHLPRDIKTRDLDAILELYAVDVGSGLQWRGTPVDMSARFGEKRSRWQGPPGPESIRDRYAALLDLCETIDKAELRIHRIDWNERDARGYPADVRLIVRGLASNGERVMLDQWARIHLDRREGRWVVTAEEIRSRELVRTPVPRFQVVTDAARLEDVHDTSGSPVLRLVGGMVIASGSAVADFNCDGPEDVALLSTRAIALYMNQADGTYRNVTHTMGLADGFDIAATGLIFFDADNDGDPDLWICGIRGQRFYRNDDCRRFIDVTEEAGLGPAEWSSMPIAADYDRDGFLDVYVVRMGDHEKSAPSPNWEAHNGVRDSLYHNNGDGTFTDVTAAAGITGRSWGLAGAWGDYNDDGYPDVYVGNEFGFNALYRNNGDGTFSNVAAVAGALDRGAAMGVAWGDYDGDGDLDLYISNMYANSRWALTHPDFPPPVPWYYSWVPRAEVDRITDELTRGNSLLRNNGDGTFTDISDQAGVRDCQWGWATEFFDYNNDGRLDVYAANGFVSGPNLDDV